VKLIIPGRLFFRNIFTAKRGVRTLACRVGNRANTRSHDCERSTHESVRHNMVKIAADKPLVDLEAPLVDIQGLDLGIQGGGGHAEPGCGS
jgi:hypothetical protein